MKLRPHALLASALLAFAALTGCSHTAGPAADKAAINASVQRWVAAVNAKDINGIMAYYVPDDSLFVYDVIPPRQYVGAAVYRKDWQGVLAAFPGAVHADVADWTIDTEGNLAYAHGTARMTGPGADGKIMDETVRITDVYRKIGGKWLVVHEHVSIPVDPVTNKPDMDYKP
jgi:ketosteroid isomerase-like protein